LARRGLFWGRNNPNHWQDYGNFTCDFDCDWSAGSSGNSRICIYGWTENPLVEYYIIEDWKNWVPSSANAKQVTIDGSVYDVFTNAMNSYNITNTNGPFTQYISVRKTPRTSGTISIYKHFEAWESLGMKMGNLYEVAFNVEGWESDGQANVKKNIIKYDGKPTDDDPVTPKEPKEADANGDYFTSTFEKGSDSWVARGDSASVKTDSSVAYDGSSSLKVTGRTDNWHGAALTLDTDAFIPGNSYSFSTAVLQNSGSPVELQLTLQQGSGDSATYTKIASVTAKSGEWTDLSSSSFTIPTGSSDMLLYVEAPDSLTDFYIDNAAGSKDGKKSAIVTGGGKGGQSTPSVTTSNGSTNPTVTTKAGSTNTGNWNKSNAGLKNVFSNHFRIGTAVSANEASQHGDFVAKHFNSITPENELKPDALLNQSASQSKGNNVNPQVQLGYGAKAILDFAAKNKIPMRGHTLVWHSQTPDWFFKENFSSNGQLVSKDIMNQRIENYINNVFTMLKTEYPTVQFYAYDVANECMADSRNGGLRPAGMNQQNGESPWNLIYGDDSYLDVAFKAAKKYAPAGCELFYNDYNEYDDGKRESIYKKCKQLYNDGLLDGIGMQSHLDTSYPDAKRYKETLDLFASIGCDIHVTELDVTCTNEQAQASYYKGIVEDILNCPNVSSLTFWGTNDGMSWRGDRNPLIFNRSYQPKAAYDSIVSLVSESEYGDGYTGGGVNTKPEETTKAPSTQTPATSTTKAPSTGTPSNITYGDVNLDGKVTVADAVAILQFLGNKDKYALTEQAKLNADVCNPGDGITANDALTIQKYDAGIVKSLPVGAAQTQVTTKAASNSTTKAPVATTTAAPKSSITPIVASFESGNSGWTSRGDSVSITSDSDSFYSGSKSVKVSGRSDAWNGIAYELGSDIKAGGTYSFSAAVMQASGATEEMMISLQYTGSDGKTAYDHIASGDVAAKTWTKLENTAYTIPAGATDLLLYIETAKSTCDIYVDDVTVASEGEKSKITTGGGTVGEIKVPERKDGVDISWIDPSKPMVAISFDDGTRDATQERRIIDALNKNGFHATFFYVGNWITSPETVKYAYEGGHEIANHTTTHPYLSRISASEIRKEFDDTDAKLKSIIGTEPSKLMRLPYLDCNATVQATLNDVPLISCAIDTQDWNGASKDQIVNTIKSNMSNGNLKNAIVLCHENYSTTASAMEEVLPYLKAQGWQVVTISEMYAVNNKQLKGGQVHTRC
ncbi:MAG: endo-1,4-beta-xylanase, partial [Ruminococcus sp.]|nr:endo-1,4-beta-xylanase [Ruminococcus sp.]